MNEIGVGDERTKTTVERRPFMKTEMTEKESFGCQVKAMWGEKKSHFIQEILTRLCIRKNVQRAASNEDCKMK